MVLNKHLNELMSRWVGGYVNSVLIKGTAYAKAKRKKKNAYLQTANSPLEQNSNE